MPFNRPLVIALLLLVVALAATQRCSRHEPASVSRSRLLMGTVVEIAASGDDHDRLDAAVTAAFAEMARIEDLMSPHRPESDVARLSGATGDLEVSAETAAVIALGLEVGATSDGAFDMTLGRLKALWGIESSAPRVPAPEEIAAALAGGGQQTLRLEGRRVIKGDPQLAVDLGGVAKGYAIDRALEVLAAAGAQSASVNAGGDMRLHGDPGGRPWRIGIQHPRDPQRLLASLSLDGGAVVTSGDYERFFESDGVRYHHLFDPRTGYPADLCQAVTVVAESAALADALATAAFVLGPEAGLALLERYRGAEGLLVATDGTVHLSAGLEGRVAWP